MLFSARARVNGPAFLAGGSCPRGREHRRLRAGPRRQRRHEQHRADSVSWGKIVLGVGLLAAGPPQLAQAPAPGSSPRCRSGWGPWTAVAGQGVRARRGAGRGQPEEPDADRGLGDRPGPARVSTTRRHRRHRGLRRHRQPDHRRPRGSTRCSAGPGQASLDSAKAWLTAHNAAVMAVLFLVFGVDLIAKGLPTLTH